MWGAYFCVGAYECDVVVVIKMGAYIHGVLILCGWLLSRLYGTINYSCLVLQAHSTSAVFTPSPSVSHQCYSLALVSVSAHLKFMVQTSNQASPVQKLFH